MRLFIHDLIAPPVDTNCSLYKCHVVFMYPTQSAPLHINLAVTTYMLMDCYVYCYLIAQCLLLML